MARIALTGIGAAIGALATWPAGGIGAWTGAAIGASIGSTVGSLLPGQRRPEEQPLQGLQVSTSANGAPIPFGYGKGRFAGQIIWSPGIVTERFEIDNQFPTPNTTTFAYSCSFAAAFGEGPGTILRVWADTKLIYKGGQPFGFFDWWEPTTEYVADDLVAYTVGVEASIYRARFAHNNHVPTDSNFWIIDDVPEWDDDLQYVPGQQVSRRPGGDSGQPGYIYVSIQPNDPGEPHEPESSPDYWSPIEQYYGAPTIYSGGETQLPDPLIQSHQGAANVSAHRGLIYAVWEDFPLANFANRLPNIRAEISYCDEVLPENEVAQFTFDGSLLLENLAATFASPHVPGRQIVALYRGDNPPSISDDAGNTWTEMFNIQYGPPGSDYFAGYRATANAYAGVNTVRFSRGGFVFTHMECHCYELFQTSVPSFVDSDSGSGGTVAITDGVQPFSLGIHPTDWQVAMMVFGPLHLVIVNLDSGPGSGSTWNNAVHPEDWVRHKPATWLTSYYR